MKVSEKIKLATGKNLKEFAKIINKNSITLINWERENPILFNMLLAGAKTIKHLEDLKKVTEIKDESNI